MSQHHHEIMICIFSDPMNPKWGYTTFTMATAKEAGTKVKAMLTMIAAEKASRSYKNKHKC